MEEIAPTHSWQMLRVFGGNICKIYSDVLVKKVCVVLGGEGQSTGGREGSGERQGEREGGNANNLCLQGMVEDTRAVG